MHQDVVLFLSRARAKLLPTYLKLYIDPNHRGSEALNLPIFSFCHVLGFRKFLILLEFVV